MKKNRIVKRGIIVAGLLAVLATITVPNFLPGSGINDGYDEIDIMTGRVRNTWKLWFVTVWSKTEDSEITKALTPEDFYDTTPNWKRVIYIPPPLTLCRWHIHYIYHGAIHQAIRLHTIWHMMETTDILSGTDLDTFKRKTAKDLLLLWQEGGQDFVANDYLAYLDDMLSRWETPAASIDERKADIDVLLALKVVKTETIDGKTVTKFNNPDERR
ncbi:MAG: hypothetical protein FWG50_04580 [Kiritimatiellaeota bacterium]|nr:hypothetical protein [Kiritimatiellota bacterium]